ncbi:FAD-containing monooxygenase EthA [Phenylobacterium sp. Root77]|nr:FAD-containing monooxygenase EthA [Phenylobacterium sp. Root1277]KQW94979.1 FAD-containing monooxygenase EthA [Phenylobacterium sp. Root1290]KRC44673.1 FAD-containing monooxygenase EthA [Phenylobacterium sp. Root77]
MFEKVTLVGSEHFDVLIVGAGLSGIGAGYHLQSNSPGKTYAILEGRQASGGTWDLFRYPGIRSDSDMYTLGYAFKPWREAKAIADGPSILKYVRDTAAENGIDRHIRYGHQVKSASWSSADARWTVEALVGPNKDAVRLTCNFLFMCTGYYDYAEGYTPPFAGTDQFQGQIVHPQKWPEDLDYSGKKVVVIGSGATAVTLVPEMAKTAAHVTMLQRSPTYVVSRPAEDAAANWLRAKLPAKLAYGITRWRNVLFGMLFFNLARKKPEKTKAQIIDMVRQHLGPDYDVATHFTPRYNPWDQRLCLVPDADLFDAIKDGSASVVTDQIDSFTSTGLKLKSGQELDADVVVTATGLKLQLLSGLQVSVDGQPVNMANTMSYKGMMYSGVPNLASAFGYTNASWTLKCDLTCEYVCRLLNHMDRTGQPICTPKPDPTVGEAPWLDFSSGYVQRSIDQFPKQGTKKPWKLHQNYALDLVSLRFGAVDDGVMQFSRPPARRSQDLAA